jgi:uncharacterized protein YigA (DUF484 family)
VTQSKLLETIVKQELVVLLRDNGDIFSRHPELLELLELSDDRGAASLLERQVSVLKNKLASFQSQQFEFIEVARENEQISDSFSRIICQLIGFSNLSEFASEFPKALRLTFEIDEVAFKTDQAASRRPNENIGYEDAVRRLSNNEAVCDDRWPSNILALFFSAQVKSAALVPMKATQDGDVIGILALGSSDPKRYTNELGTAHLNRLGLMAGTCLARLQPAI